MAAPYTGPTSVAFEPDANAAWEFLSWWFGKCNHGQIELGWTAATTGQLTAFRRFDLEDESIIEAIVAINKVPGQNLYFRAASIAPDSPSGHTTDAFASQAPGPWADFDTIAQVTSARGIMADPETKVKPCAWVRTGSLPEPRYQVYTLCSEPLVSAPLIRQVNTQFVSLYGGDKTVVNASRLMRLPGGIAWPYKAGREPELIVWGKYSDRPAAYPLATITGLLPPVAVGEPRPKQTINGSGGETHTETKPAVTLASLGMLTRYNGFIKSLLESLSASPDGEKHSTLLRIAKTVGGVQVAAGITDDDAVELLVGALPDTVADWQLARKTARGGLAYGRAEPIVLEDRPRSPQDPPPPFNEATGRMVIRVHAGQRHLAADAGLVALSHAGVPFYQRDRTMVRAAPSKAKTSDGLIVEVPSLLAVSLPMLARALGQSAEWEKVLKDGTPARIDPPREVVEQIAAMVGSWPFPPVAGVIGTPTMRPDGSLLLTPGYDEATGLVLVAPPAMPDIPDEPTYAQAKAALERLNGLLVEFPFASDASRAVALSMLLTPVLRGALGAAVPMHVVAAPQPGSGKSYLQDVASVLATGERCAVITIAPDPNETEKRLVGAALAGFPIIALDNCNGVLTGDFLAQVTERPLLQLRPLGTSGVQRIANVFTVFANGNNIAVAADLARRTALCTLDANEEAPETREFNYDPVAMILEDRGRYLADVLTIARAYHCAGYPDRLVRVPSFERWSDLVRSALVWLGRADPVDNAAIVKAEDPERSKRSAIFDTWIGPLELGQKYTVAEIIAKADTFNATAGQYNWPDFRAAIHAVSRLEKTERSDPQKLGHWLARSANVIIGGRKLLRENGRITKWSLDEL